MNVLVERGADALKWIDSTGVAHKNFQPGVGPYGEPQLVRKCLEYLRERFPDEFSGAQSKREPDVLIPGRWALEVKLVRPFGDNGRPAEHWSENLLHPYDGNVSALGDCLKLMRSDRAENKGVLVIAYSHLTPRVDLDVLFTAFELLARDVRAIRLGRRCVACRKDLIHPVHQQLEVIGWEVLGAAS